MEWSKEKALELIDAYRERRILWDPTQKSYHNVVEKECAWEEIAAQFDVPAENCKKKLYTMSAGYRRERDKTKFMTRKGTRYVSKWFAFDAFRFLETRQFPHRKPVKENDDEYVETEVIIQNNYDDAVEVMSISDEQIANSVELPNIVVEHPVRVRKRLAVASPERRTTSSLSERVRNSFADDDTSVLESVLEILKEKPVNVDKETPKLNEIDAFFKYVSTKVHNYSEPVQRRVQHAIFDILLKADTGYFDARVLE